MGHSHIFLEGVRPRHKNEFEWEHISSTTAESFSADLIAGGLVYSTIRELQDGHAYSLKELRELGNILGMQGDRESEIERLQRESDMFAFLVGWRVQHERRLSGKERVRDVRKRFYQPATALSEALSDREFIKEFSVTWGGFKDFDHAKFKQDLETAVAAANRHVAAI